jgi:phosphoribosylamine---glycine ligase
VAGPSKYASQLEGSKDFSKAFMMEAGIPTAAYQTFTAKNIHDGADFIDSLESPYVLKADGLAAGKGVIITEDAQEAKAVLKEMILEQKFGESSAKVVIEEFLKGIEISVFVVSDGKDYQILGSAKDYKRIGVGDTGLNTGGMGAISPVPFADADFMKKVEDRIIKPTFDLLREKGHPYKGFLFLGLMNANGDPQVIEYNVRMGDPETEAIFPRLKTDMVAMLSAIGKGELGSVAFELEPKTAATVFVVSEGYPGAVQKGIPMNVKAAAIAGSQYVFHAGVKSENGVLVTNGGRVTAVTVLEDSLDLAIKKSQELAQEIQFEGAYYRTDIGLDLQQYGH